MSLMRSEIVPLIDGDHRGVSDSTVCGSTKILQKPRQPHLRRNTLESFCSFQSFSFPSLGYIPTFSLADKKSTVIKSVTDAGSLEVPYLRIVEEEEKKKKKKEGLSLRYLR
ncbi:hypothetical protein CEXT_156831 [Caerostris extrusa]|uniref:Uncharacterized protein n=1 Tax=Caerostris extrusa TaxID=172846 RepID=A0AAV4N046_CAEEX|nr:hypothetical protein CEXT_156831 [Caerostris extrusa]